MIKFIISDLPFNDWTIVLCRNNNIIHVDKDELKKYEFDKYLILPISVSNYNDFKIYSNSVFKNNAENIDILENKSKFAKYMMNNYIENIPETIYYNFDNEAYINKNFINKINIDKLIQKRNISAGGCHINIVYNIAKDLKNYVISKYIEHIRYYVGHFLILNGKIIKKIYFYSEDPLKNGIKCGQIKNYIITSELHIDDSIYDKIFYDLSYSGFACADFIIDNNKIIIFEINPRPGGSLIYNSKCFQDFLIALKIQLNIKDL